MRNLYRITDKDGRKVLFSPNWAQNKLIEDMWYKNIILKARQLGISTYLCILFLDRCLFNSNLSAGIIAHTREDSEQLFKKVKFAYENLPLEIRRAIPAKSDRVSELMFQNGSSFRVGTSMRSSTLQLLHISEFGKICAKYPDKAEEIITGSLNTISPDQHVFIESTAEGREGYFYDMCKIAENNQKMGKELTKLDYRFHFFPWWKEKAYRIGSVGNYTTEMVEYFASLKTRGIVLDDEQMSWYSLYQKIQSEKMFREYPSTPDEAWESAVNGAYYSQQMALCRHEKRIGFIPYDHTVPVHTAWDLGFNDSTAIWFFQVVGKEIHLIEYIEGSGESLAHWLGIVKSKPYVYGKHLAPHDIMAHEYTSGMTRQASARKMGISFSPATKTEIIPGIDAARALLSRCFFDERKTDLGIKCLENYKKKWNDRTGTWSSEPLHDKYSHCFVGETEVLTLFGKCQIMNLKKEGLIHTECGLRRYINPRMTRESAPLVEVKFKDGFTVRCTPEHLFRTEKGWKSAESLEKDSVILSGSIPYRGILTDISIALEKRRDILLEIEDIFTEEYGKMLLEKSLQGAIFTIKMETGRITISKTLNASPSENIYHKNGKNIEVPLFLQRSVGDAPQYGIAQKREGSGIKGMPKSAEFGKNGKDPKDHAYSVELSLMRLIGKEETAKNTVPSGVNRIFVQSVINLEERGDVWCLTVPDEHNFCLQNGAIVHNCADAFRVLATGISLVTNTSDTSGARLGGPGLEWRGGVNMNVRLG